MALPVGTYQDTSPLTLEPNPEISAKAESSPELSLTSGWSPQSSPQSLPQSSQHSVPAVSRSSSTVLDTGASSLI
ncbi:hypothetical protein M404DRAFT_25045 [Pisolithus tinctorius Marx 270]|uniref:Uncharacterized protein n=1 Tax=Pisolithus tinctorius Marx 270 TaxID=870435 RepID=A0A0C3PD83_PISTI|nr:hypothetical protein M404DRAFT_25045 [Pisolithus tinctorius Marx 270]